MKMSKLERIIRRRDKLQETIHYHECVMDDYCIKGLQQNKIYDVEELSRRIKELTEEMLILNHFIRTTEEIKDALN